MLSNKETKSDLSQFRWGSRIHRLHLCSGVRPSPITVLGMTLNQHAKASILELWGMQNSPYLLLLPGPLWSEVLVSVRVPFIGQIEMFNHLLYLKQFNCVSIELLVLDSNTWNYLTVCKQMTSGLFKDVIYKQFVYKSYTFNTNGYTGFGMK